MSLKELIRTFEVLRDEYLADEDRNAFIEEGIKVYSTAVEMLNELKQRREQEKLVGKKVSTKVLASAMSKMPIKCDACPYYDECQTGSDCRANLQKMLEERLDEENYEWEEK